MPPETKISDLTVDELTNLIKSIVRDALREGLITHQLEQIPFDDKDIADWPPVLDLGTWPVDLSLRREDMYDDDGR